MVSIITPSHNSKLYIENTVQSVIDQTYTDWEMIIIDDNSTDGTRELIARLAEKDSRIKYFFNDVSIGPAKARNIGIENAKGQFLTFLDSDDIWMPEFIQTSVEYSIKNNYTFVFSSYERKDENLNDLYTDFIVPDKVSYSDLLRTCPISCLTAFIWIEKIGKFYMPDIPKRQDYGLWLRILKHVKYAYGIKTPLAVYRIRKGSLSRNKFLAIWYVWQVYINVEKLNFFYSLYLICLL
nr:glycosyltransferase family 2 protein [Mucilaginibacter sp. L294]